MKITILATLLMMLAYFLVLYGAVGYPQRSGFFRKIILPNTP